MTAIDPVDRACRLHERAEVARMAGQFDRAIARDRKAVRLLVATVGGDHPDVANVLNHLAHIYQDRANYAAAVRTYRRAARIVKKLPVEGDLARIRIHA